jgi:hypothetical protein
VVAVVKASIPTQVGVVGGEASVKEIAALTLIPIGIIGGAVALGYFLLRPKAGECWFYDVVCKAGEAGKATTQALYNAQVVQTERAGGLFTGLEAWKAAQRAVEQGSHATLVSIPQTPVGNYTSSNWTWEDDTGANLECDTSGKCTGQGPLMIGLPAGQTLPEFCDGSPGSPICAGVTPMKKGVFGLGVFGL